MSQKSISRNSNVLSIPSAPKFNRRPILLIIIASILVLLLAVGVAEFRTSNESAANITHTAAVPYGNAMAMQYAQPYLNVSAPSAGVAYGNSLALQYAQPYLNNTAVSVNNSATSPLALQYAQPWIDAQAGSAGSAPVSPTPLELQYAQAHLGQ